MVMLSVMLWRINSYTQSKTTWPVNKAWHRVVFVLVSDYKFKGSHAGNRKEMYYTRTRGLSIVETMQELGEVTFNIRCTAQKILWCHPLVAGNTHNSDVKWIESTKAAVAAKPIIRSCMSPERGLRDNKRTLWLPLTLILQQEYGRGLYSRDRWDTQWLFKTSCCRKMIHLSIFGIPPKAAFYYHKNANLTSNADNRVRTIMIHYL